MMKFIEERPATATALLVLIAVVIVGIVIWKVGHLETLTFSGMTYDGVVDLLTPLFLIALFLERAIEVFVSTSRRLGRADMETRLDKATEKIKQLNDRLKQFQAQLDAPGASHLADDDLSAIHKRMQNVSDVVPSAQRAVRSAEAQLERYRARTRLVAFAAGVALGLVVAIAGIRVISPLVDVGTAQWPALQSFVFHCVDVVLTSGLLAGGASGIHQIVSVFGEYTDKVRKGVQA